MNGTITVKFLPTTGPESWLLDLASLSAGYLFNAVFMFAETFWISAADIALGQEPSDVRSSITLGNVTVSVTNNQYTYKEFFT